MLESLHIQNYRLFKDLKIDKLGQVNLIAGKNNTGKTALLEALILGYVSSVDAFNFILSNRNEYDINGFTMLDSLFHKNDISSKIKIQFDFNGIRTAIVFSKDLNNKREEVYNVIFLPADSRDIPYIVKPISHVIALTPFFTKAILIPFNFFDKLLNRFWANISLTNKEEELVKILQLIEPKISKIRIEDSKAKVLLIGDLEPIPLKKLGDGINRLLIIGLALINAKNKPLLIDEFEVGLHYSVQEQLWDVIFKYAKEWNIQVFATTHSRDTVKSFTTVAQKEENKGMANYFRLQKLRNSDDIVAVQYDEENLKTAIEQHIETR